MKYLPSTIINFHAVQDSNWMEKVLKLLKKHYNMISITSLEHFYFNKKNIKNSCHITFDDGDSSFYNIVFPLLKKYNIPASIFISPKIATEGSNFWFQEVKGYNSDVLLEVIKKYVDLKDETIFHNQSIDSILRNFPISQIRKIIQDYQLKTNSPPKQCMNMNVRNIIDLHKSGLVTIGAHTLNHPILKNETHDTAFNEITKSINDLSSIIQTQVKYFAYPNGIPGIDFSQREINILRQAGVRLAFSTENKSINQLDNPLSIPRNGISKGSNAFLIAKLLSGKHWQLIRSIYKGKKELDYRFNMH